MVPSKRPAAPPTESKVKAWKSTGKGKFIARIVVKMPPVTPILPITWPENYNMIWYNSIK